MGITKKGMTQNAKRRRKLRETIRKGNQGGFHLDDVHDRRVDRTGFIIYVFADPEHPGTGEESSDEPGVEYRMSDRFEMNLNVLSGIDPNRTIIVMLASCGGDWNEGMRMFAAIVTCTNPVVVIAQKDARSMTSIIPLAADYFVIRPPAEYMIHRGQYGMSGLDQEADTHDIKRREANARMMLIYATRLKHQGILRKKNIDEIKQILGSRMQKEIDVWFSADDAVRYGFADDVFVGDMAELRSIKRNATRRTQMMNALRARIRVAQPRVTITMPRGPRARALQKPKH